MISSEKNKDLWIEDYIKRVKVLSAQEIIIKPQKFKLYYLKMVIFFYIVLMIIFGVISQSVIVFAFGAVQVMILYVQNRIIYKNTRNRIIDKIQNM